MTHTLRATRLPLLGLCLAILASTAATQPQLRYRVTEITPPNAGEVAAFPPDIDNRGQIVGATDDFVGGVASAFLRNNRGTFFDLVNLPGATQSASGAIGQNGKPVGASGTVLIGPGSAARAAMWDRNGNVTDIGLLDEMNDTFALANDADSSGRVIGASGTENLVDTRAFLWERGVMSHVDIPGFAFASLEAFGAGGRMAGTAWNIDPFFDGEGFITDKHGNVEMIGFLPNGSASLLVDMNRAGAAVGSALDAPLMPMAPPSVSAIVYDKGTLTSFGKLPGDFIAQFSAISLSGDAVGRSFGPPVFPFGASRGVISRRGGPLEVLNDLLEPAAANWFVFGGEGINQRGEIIAGALDLTPPLGPLPVVRYVLLTPIR